MSASQAGRRGFDPLRPLHLEQPQAVKIRPQGEQRKMLVNASGIGLFFLQIAWIFDKYSPIHSDLDESGPFLPTFLF